MKISCLLSILKRRYEKNLNVRKKSLGEMKTITLILGDGIGPEIIDSCIRVIEAADVKF